MTSNTVASRQIWCTAASALLVGVSITGCGDAISPSAETHTSASISVAQSPQGSVGTSTAITPTTSAVPYRASEAPAAVPNGVFEATTVTGFGGVELVPIRIAFDAPDLHIFAGCHHATGIYRLTDGRLFMDEGMSGKGVGCESEDIRNGKPWVYDFLPMGPVVTLDGDLLTLKSDRGAPQSIAFKRVKDARPTLTETVWWLTTMEHDGTRSVAPLGLNPTIRFFDGHVEFGAPCNEIVGDVTVTDSRINIALKPTAVQCTDPRGKVEQALVDALNGARAYSLNSDSSLTLTGSGGGLVLLPSPVTKPSASG